MTQIAITILIADDSLFQRTVLGKAAREQGYAVVEARDGLECLDRIRGERPAVVCLDLNMPGLKGQEVLETLAQEGLAVPAIVVSADVQHSTRARCEELGARAFLNKPVAPEAFIEALRKVLHG